MNKKFQVIFKRGSKTYYNSTLFFPKDVREDVTVLYSFVRTADDFVDRIPQDKNGFTIFFEKTINALEGKKTRNDVIDEFSNLIKRKDIKKEWIISFMKSMKSDIEGMEYKTFNDTLRYIYGSAEVIGFMMARIMNLEEESYYYAGMLGRSMQYINFIRDVDEDNMLGRRYIPQEVLHLYGLPNLHKETAYRNKSNFKKMIRGEIQRYIKWSDLARKGFVFIPKKYLSPIKTADQMYRWTACEIYKDPFIVYERKIKPTRRLILVTALKNILTSYA